MMRKLVWGVALVAACCAQRATAQTCTLVITSPLNFGIYTGAQIRATTPYVVTCQAKNDGWNFPFNLTGSDTANLRHLAGPGGATLGYAIYRDSAYSQVWGTGTNEMTGTGSTNGTIYAQLNANQTAANGGYSETVTSNTQSLQLTAQINPTCSITANPLAFGNYSGALLNGTTTLSVTCTSTTFYNVGLNAGTATGATVTNRMMTGPGGKTLKYSLFSDSGRTTNWGNSSGSWVFGIGTGAAQTLTVYGQMPASQNTISGTYTDTIVATVNY